MRDTKYIQRELCYFVEEQDLLGEKLTVQEQAKREVNSSQTTLGSALHSVFTATRSYFSVLTHKMGETNRLL